MSDLLAFMASDGARTIMVKFASVARGFRALVTSDFGGGKGFVGFLSALLIVSVVMVLDVVVTVIAGVSMVVVVVRSCPFVVLLPFELVVFHFSV